MGFFQTLGEGYKIMGQEAKENVVNNRANILTGVSVIGTIITGVVSAFAGAKSARQIDAKSVEMQRPLTFKEKAKLCWKNFIGPAASVVGSGAGAISSNRIMAGDIARLTTDVAVVTKAYSEFKKASNEVLTEKQQNEIKDKMAEKEIQKMTPQEINRIPDHGGPGVTQLFKDSFSGIVFFSTRDKLELSVSKMREMMADLKPRNRMGYSPTEHGIRFKEWLDYVGALENSSNLYTKDVDIYNHFGWNKGYNDGEVNADDDSLDYYLSPGEIIYQGEPRSCYVIYWDQNPSDLRLGDIMKSNQV